MSAPRGSSTQKHKRQQLARPRQPRPGRSAVRKVTSQAGRMMKPQFPAAKSSSHTHFATRPWGEGRISRGALLFSRDFPSWHLTVPLGPLTLPWVPWSGQSSLPCPEQPFGPQYLGPSDWYRPGSLAATATFFTESRNTRYQGSGITLARLRPSLATRDFGWRNGRAGWMTGTRARGVGVRGNAQLWIGWALRAGEF